MELVIKKVWNKGILIINHKTLIMKVVLDLFSITPWFVAALDWSTLRDSDIAGVSLHLSSDLLLSYSFILYRWIIRLRL